MNAKDIEKCPVCECEFHIDDGYTWTEDGLTCSLECHKEYYQLFDDEDVVEWKVIEPLEPAKKGEVVTGNFWGSLKHGDIVTYDYFEYRVFRSTPEDKDNDTDSPR